MEAWDHVFKILRWKFHFRILYFTLWAMFMDKLTCLQIQLHLVLLNIRIMHQDLLIRHFQLFILPLHKFTPIKRTIDHFCMSAPLFPVSLYLLCYRIQQLTLQQALQLHFGHMQMLKVLLILPHAAKEVFHLDK